MSRRSVSGSHGPVGTGGAGAAGLDLSTVGARLSDSSADMKSRTQLIMELKETLDLRTREAEVNRHMDSIVPAIQQALEQTQPVFHQGTVEYKFRHALLDTIQRVPMHEVMRPHASSVVQMCVHIARIDNEENVAICLKILLECVRSFRGLVEGSFQAYLAVLMDMFKQVPSTVEEVFGEAAIPLDPDPLADANDQPQPAPGRSEHAELPSGMKSLKVLHEVASHIVHLVQAWKSESYNIAHGVLPVAVAAIMADPLPQRRCRAAAAERGLEPFIGIAPAINRANKRAQFLDLMTLQIKTMTLLSYLTRGKAIQNTELYPEIPKAFLRLVKALPPEQANHRKDLIVAVRQFLMSAEMRPAFKDFLDELLNLDLCTVADLIHHYRADMTPQHLQKAISWYTSAFHDETVPASLHVLISKLFVNIIESLHQRDDPALSRFYILLMEAFIDKLEALAGMRDFWPSRTSRKDKGKAREGESKEGSKRRSETAPSKEAEQDALAEEIAIERAKVIGGINIMQDHSPEHLGGELRYLVRNVLSGLSQIFAATKGAAAVDASTLGRLWTAGIRCFSIFDLRRDHREFRDAYDCFCPIWAQLDLVVFVESIEPHMEFFVEEITNNGELLGIAQYFLSSPALSRTFMALCLRHLMARLPKLSKDKHSTTVLRLFKMCFMAVTVFADNEMILQPHVGAVIMESLNIAAQDSEPGAYYALLRSLFRSVGGGRFEALYKEVLPLLQSVLEELNRLLASSTEQKDRELFAELCLTVPVRLSVLLPFLNFLMQPLVTALRATNELIAQGLRTLELCVDNLTQEFLNPLMAPVIHDVMTSLWKLLKPLPHPQAQSHATVRILGKLGGRNRRLLGPPALEWREISEQAKMVVKLDGEDCNLALKPMVEVAAKLMGRGDQHYRQHGFDLLKKSLPLFMTNEPFTGEKAEVFQTLFKGLCHAARSADFGAEARQVIEDAVEYIFAAELFFDKNPPRTGIGVSQAIIEGLLENMTSLDGDHVDKATELAYNALSKLLAKVEATPPRWPDVQANVLRGACTKACSACYDHSAARKIAGGTFLSLFVFRLKVGEDWLVAHELEIARAILFAHKDSVGIPPAKLELVKSTLIQLLRVCNGNAPADSAAADAGNGPPAGVRDGKLEYLIGLLVTELQSQTQLVRHLAQDSLKALAEVKGRSLSDLTRPCRDRLTGIFSKPLRALAFPLQIGHLDALTFGMAMRPPLFEWGPPFHDALGRILQEALGIAEAEDSALLGRGAQVKVSTPLINLRVVCVKFLATVLACPDFPATSLRGRILAAYFKLLYARAPEVVDAAHTCLKELLSLQEGRLPKDLLQSGLRPVLMNLSDYKKLTVPSLQGLARLLEILTNYFKVEIGTKLLDHFRSLADPAQLRAARIAPDSESGELKIMAAIVDVFHLLPHPQAGTFLTDLIDGVVTVEALLSKVTQSHFTKPLCDYLENYPEAAAGYFLKKLREPRYLQTLRALLTSDAAPKLREQFQRTAAEWLHESYRGDMVQALQGSLLLQELARKDPAWIAQAGPPNIVEIATMRWVSKDRKDRLATLGEEHAAQTKEDRVMLDIMMICVRQDAAKHIDLFFHIADVFMHNSPIDCCFVVRFLYEHLVGSTDMALKGAVLNRFLAVVGNDGVSMQHKAAIYRYLINPLLTIVFRRGASEAALVDADFVSKAQNVIWGPFATAGAKRVRLDALDLEVIQFTRSLVEHRQHLMSEFRKEIIKFGWSFVQARAHDYTVKHAAHVLVARFCEAYDCPAKIMTTFTYGVLRANPVEARALANEALDILIAACPRQYKEGEWVRMFRTRLLEDSQNLQTVSTIFHAIVRKADVFYPYRDVFMPLLLAAMPRLALNAHNVAAYRLLTVEIAEMIIAWELRRSESAADDDAATERAEPEPSPKRIRLDRSASAVPSTAGSDKSRASVVPLVARDQIVTVLVRVITATPEASERGPLVAKTTALLRRILTEVWPETEVKLQYFERFLMEPTEQTLAAFCSTAEAMAISLANKTDAWLLANLATIRSLMQKGLNVNSSPAHRSLQPVVDRAFAALPPSGPDDEPVPAEVRAFEDWAVTVINEGLREAQQNPRQGMSAALTLLEAWGKAQPDRVDQFFAALLRVLHRAMKEHMSASNNDRPEALVIVDSTRRYIERLCEVLRPRVAFMGEQRRTFLQCLVALVEKTPSTEMCRYILDLQRKWLDEKVQLPTPREKASMLIKMMSFDSRGDEALFHDYLGLILDIYTNPDFVRSELTVRLENAFLLGCRCRDADVRSRFMEVFDSSITRGVFSRLYYIFGVQSWETIADTQWMHQALDLLIGSVDLNEPLVLEPMLPLGPDEKSSFFEWAAEEKAEGVLTAARRLLYADATASLHVWVSLFKGAWATFSKREHVDLSRYFVNLFTKEFLLKGVERRPNVVQIILAGLRAAQPAPLLPPHLVRYLGKTYCAWHLSLEMLQDVYEDAREDESLRELTGDAMAQLYAELGEDDVFYGHWRRRAICPETNAGLAYEQLGEWDAAQQAYEIAQSKGRANLFSFTKGEYHLWEDHWVLCAEKLQQWEILLELSRAEGTPDLMLESLWRVGEWAADLGPVQGAIDQLPPVRTPRRTIFEAFVALLRTHAAPTVEELRVDFLRLCEEGTQVALRRWSQLPEVIGGAHIPLLQTFQQLLELQEASQIFASLHLTNQQNLEIRAGELKHIMQTWRERLPNAWDDINVWSDLVSWRQHVFGVVNKAYLPLIPMAHGQPANANSQAYRGYHETAWIINRFAHVARKHGLFEVCHNSLTKIYTLPNIEISEAFLKLREQAKCHFQNPAELGLGLDVINNTNLMYFGAAQKAEFFTMKGMFLARLNLHDEAAQVFSQAVGLDMSFPKAWAEWGAYQDRLFEQSPQSLGVAAHAVNSYLQASSLYKNGKVRKLLIRILWLLGQDDGQGTIAKALDSYKGDLPVWQWTYFVPQLLNGLSTRSEAVFCKIVLLRIAKAYPQALFYQARATREELAIVRKALEARSQQLAAAAAAAANANGTGSPQPNGQPSGSQPSSDGQSQSRPPTATPQPQLNPAGHLRIRAWEYLAEITGHAKTQFPLLTLSMEMLCDQLFQRFKPGPDEDLHRLIQVLLNDGLGQYIARSVNPEDDLALSESMKTNIARFAENLGKMPLHAQFHSDFVGQDISLPLFISRLERWRREYEKKMDRRSLKLPLENHSHYLIEFQYQKFDEIEVPGQYLKRHNEENNTHFVKIQRFSSRFDVLRARDASPRRITVIGQDGSTHIFFIQVPSARSSRREEKIMQFFRMLDCTLASHAETRMRNATFNIPAAVPLSSSCRLLETDASSVSLQDVWDKHCSEQGIGRDDPLLAWGSSMRALRAQNGQDTTVLPAQLEVADELATKYFPSNILKNVSDPLMVSPTTRLIPDIKYMLKTLSSPSELWHFRKRFAVQMATFIFMTNTFSINSRIPYRVHFARGSGNMTTSDMVPAMSNIKPEFRSDETVPFRLTPNMQHLLLRQNIEGLLTATLVAVAHSLTEDDHDLAHRLSIFVRDEVATWHGSHNTKVESTMHRDQTLSNVDEIVKKAKLLACNMERAATSSGQPILLCQTVTELINQATSPARLYAMDPMWLPWL